MVEHVFLCIQCSVVEFFFLNDRQDLIKSLEEQIHQRVRLL